MPGLTITTGGTPVAGATSESTGAGAGSQPHPPPPNPQPAAGRRGSRASSPSRPPVSPITPTLGPTQLPGAAPPTSQISPLLAGNNINNNIPDFAQGRPVFTHSQPDQVGISQLPPVQPISFDDNPDVLALKSAISILQLQRARAQADMQALSQAREAALADPGAFIADLTEGRVTMEGDPLFSGRVQRGQDVDPSRRGSPSSSSSSSDDEDEDEEEEAEDGDSPAISQDNNKPTDKNKNKNKSQTPSNRKTGKLKKENVSGSDSRETWRKLPKPQTVVRMPPINWAQYGVVGESLDKLHAEQLAAPTSGTPVPLGPGGTFEFKAATEQMIRDEQASQLQQPPQRLPGIAAPYTPGKDKILLDKDKEKKGRQGKR